MGGIIRAGQGAFMVEVYLEGKRHGSVPKTYLRTVEEYFEGKYGPVYRVSETEDEVHYSLWAEETQP